MAHGECPMAIALKEKRQVRGMEAIAERPDGVRMPFLACPTPLYDDAGQLTGGVNMLVDISERKRAEEQQSLLIRELHHRVKNTLATVQAIMGSTAHTADTVEDFKTALIGRIGSLAKTHLLLADEARTTSLSDLLHKELDAFDDSSEGRIVMHGPPVDLSTQLAVSLGMALHELDHQRRQVRRAVGPWRQGDRPLAGDRRGGPPHARLRLGGKRRPAGRTARAPRLRHAAAGNRAAGPDPRPHRHRLRAGRGVRALYGAAAGAELACKREEARLSDKHCRHRMRWRAAR